MNINEYKDAMDEIKPRQVTYQQLEQTLAKKKRIRNRTLAGTAVLLILIFMLLPTFFKTNDNLIMITVHGDNQSETTLSENNVVSELYAFPSTLTYGSEDETGTYELYFEFTGRNIDEITFICSTEDITRNDIDKVTAYFAKTIEKSISEDNYDSFYKEFHESEIFLRSMGNPDTKTRKFTSLEGKSYTEKKDNDNSETYSLMINASKNEDDTFSIEDILLNLQIKYLDGTMEKKDIMILENNDVSEGVEVKILN